MNVLVTGAAGFIGFHLTLYLKSRKDKVLGLDNFNSYYDLNLKLSRERILKDNDVEVIHADIRDKELIKKLIRKNNFSHVIHLAAQAGVRNSILNPDDYIASNLEGFISLLEACKENPKIKIIYASSSSVYGKNTKIPFSTTDRTDTPTNLYGATKKANELIAHSYHHLFNIPMIGLRYFTAYGPWGRPDMAYYKFTDSIINEIPIDVYGYGKMKRDFTYIDDIVEGTIAALDSDIEFDIFNLGNSHPIKILDFIALLENLLQKKAKINLLPMQKGEVIETFADIIKSRELLKFNPKTSLEDGLNKFIKWYKEYNCSHALEKEKATLANALKKCLNKVN